MDTAHPPIPAIAVASAAHIYIYKVRKDRGSLVNT